MDERNAARRLRHRERQALARKQRGDACEDCGSSDRLEWDHLDPATKRRNLADMDSYGDEAFWLEVAKCRLLCRPCHVSKSLAAGEFHATRPKPLHGLTGYVKRKCRCDVCCAAGAESRARSKRLRV